MSNNLPLQPLVWFELENTNRLICEVVTPICEYSVWKNVDSVAYSVLYYNRHTEAPTKEATGFATIDEAKQWAWNHYNEKMQPYVKPAPTWIDASEQLPQVDVDTQFICAYDSAIEPYVKVTYFDKSLNEFDHEHEGVLAWMPIPEFSTMQNNKGE